MTLPRRLRFTCGAFVAALLIVLWCAPPAMAQSTCLGIPADLEGTPGADVLVGDSTSEVIVGLGGNDLIVGAGGDDLVCAGPGVDSVFGDDPGTGSDLLLGEAESAADATGLGARRLRAVLRPVGLRVVGRRSTPPGTLATITGGE